jgi:hypothetical protein
MFRISRPSLVSEIWSRSQNGGSVLITGSPGAGKSWLVAQIVRNCQSNGRSYLALIAEDYPVGSMEDLSSALGFKTDVVSFLHSLPGNPVLIIDGLDSLRSDPSQRTFRELIRRLPRQAPRCSVVASIRTFDLRQSEEFQQLFFSSSTSPERKGFVEISVPPLSDEEVSVALRQVPELEPLIRSANVEFRKLLSNPFNLRLAAELMQGGAALNELSSLDSQVQLLTKYWSWRVETPADRHDRKAFLRIVSGAMVRQKSLSVSEVEVYAPGLGAAFSALQSDEVLRESPTGRISFTHNILFDYGVARLLMDESNVAQFILQDPSRTIFFRPSLAYFFHYLWLLDRDLFWVVGFSFFQSTALPERARIVPAVTVYEAARKLQDLNPILSVSSETEIRAMAGTLRAVQALGGLQSGARKLWLSVLVHLSSTLKIEFINEYTALLNLAEETKTPDEARTIFSCAEKLLRWIWDLGGELGRGRAVSLADFGAARVLPLVLKNYSSSPKAAHEISLRVLDRYGSPLAGANEAFRLAQEMKTIIGDDPAMAVEIYRRTFGYKEESQETTRIGGGAALSMTSTRAQDFSTALYALQATFLTFLHLAPEDAAIAAIEAVNAEIERERPDGTRSESKPPQEFTFQYEGQQVTYRADFSEIWDSGTRQYTSLNLLNSVLNFVSEDLSKSENSAAAARILRAVACRSSFAVTWKRLLQIAVVHIRVMYPFLRDLLTIPEFISAPETTIGVGEVLKLAYKEGLVSAADGLAIESSILAVPNAGVILRYEKPESIRNRLLMCIPRDKIQSPEAALLAESLLKTQGVRENKPYHTVSFFQKSYGTEDWLRDEGVDTAAEENTKILEAMKPLQDFELKYLNEAPSLEACTKVEPFLQRLNALLNESVPADKVAEAARGTLCSAAESVLKNAQLTTDSSVLQLCRGIVLDGARDDSPRPNPEYDLSFDMPSWGGSLPRIESAQGLAHYLWNWGPDAEVVERLRELSHDAVPAVRFQVAHGLLGFWNHKEVAQFWTFLEDMIVREQTPGVMMALVAQIGQIAGIEPERVARLLSSIFERGIPTTKRSDLTQSLLQVLVGLYVVRDNDEANKQLLRFEADPLSSFREVSQEIYVAAHYLTPSVAREPDVRLRAREIFLRILAATYGSLEKLSLDETRTDKSEDFGNLLKLLDEVATRLFMALDVSPYRPEGSAVLDDISKGALYFELKPIIELLTVGRSLTGKHYVAPHTALYLMQTLNAMLAFDPAAIIQYAAAVCRAGSAMNYHFDPDSIGEIVKLVEHVLADHREVLRDSNVANSLGEMLDMFVSAGWPQAMSLTFRLDQVIR